MEDEERTEAAAMRRRLAEQHEEAAAAYRGQLDAVRDPNSRARLSQKIREHEEAAAFNSDEARRAENGAAAHCEAPARRGEPPPEPAETGEEAVETLQEPPRGWTR